MKHSYNSWIMQPVEMGDLLRTKKCINIPNMAERGSFLLFTTDGVVQAFSDKSRLFDWLNDGLAFEGFYILRAI